MRLKKQGEQFDESSESNFTTTKSLYLIKSTDDMIKPFRDKMENVTRAFSFNGGLRINFTLKWVILGPFAGQQ